MEKLFWSGLEVKFLDWPCLPSSCRLWWHFTDTWASTFPVRLEFVFVERKKKSVFLCLLPLSLSLLLSSHPNTLSILLSLLAPLNTFHPSLPPLHIFTSISVFLTANRFMTAGCDLTPPSTFSTTQKNVMIFCPFSSMRPSRRPPSLWPPGEIWHTDAISQVLSQFFSRAFRFLLLLTYCQTLCAPVFIPLFAVLKYLDCRINLTPFQ